MEKLVRRPNAVILFISLSLLMMLTTGCQEIKLKAGYIWVVENNGGKPGYNVYYACTMYPHHPHCELTLPMS